MFTCVIIYIMFSYSLFSLVIMVSLKHDKERETEKEKYISHYLM